LTQTRTGLDAFVAAGAGSQLIYVVPRLDLVVAIASSSSIAGGSQGFVDDVALPAASATSIPPRCIGQLMQGRTLR